MVLEPRAPPRELDGRYALFEVIASGGMASVHYGLRTGPAGFSRVVAIKRLHPALSGDPECAAMLLDEARLAARIRHPNVVAMLDVIEEPKELFLVMEYVHGESLSRLIRGARARGQRVPFDIAATLLADALEGLHAAHEATGQEREPLRIVHRDMSPQNVIVGADGAARVVDFGIAKAAWRLQVTRGDQLKGKLGYMAPEQLLRNEVDHRADLWSASVVLWETLTCRRLFDPERAAETRRRILAGEVSRPGTLVDGLPSRLEEVVMRGLRVEPAARFATARQMAMALEQAVPRAAPRQVAAWVQQLAGSTLEQRSALIEQLESDSRTATPLGVPARQGPGPAAPGPVHSSNRPAVALAAGAALLLFAILFLLVGHGRGHEATPAASAAAPPASVLVRHTEPAASIASATAASSAASSSSSFPARRPPRPPNPPNCNPPYTVDKLGVRVPKPACYR